MYKELLGELRRFFVKILKKIGINLILKRVLFFINIILNKKNEPFFSLKILFCYLFNNKSYPIGHITDFSDKFILSKNQDFIYISYRNERYTYPKILNKQRAIDNFNTILNEQSQNSPHKYNTKIIKSNWIVHDIGTSEGYQVKYWLKKAKQVILFEPDKGFYQSLLKTFENEIKNEKVIVINFGVSNKPKKYNYSGAELKFDSLINLIKNYGLPNPDYIKADIEGEELNFLLGSKELFEKNIVKYIEITIYHRPNEWYDIPNFLKGYKGKDYFSPGLVICNRDGENYGSYNKLYQPVIRKCLYSYHFSNK